MATHDYFVLQIEANTNRSEDAFNNNFIISDVKCIVYHIDEA